MLPPRLKRLAAAGILIALAVNIAVLGVHLWSRGGQTTVVQVHNVNGEFRALSDGKLVAPRGSSSARIDVPEQGTIVLLLTPAPPALPSPNGIDRVVVRHASGEVLFEDDFDTLDQDTWEVLSGDFVIDDGVLTALDVDEDNSVLLQHAGWSDYSVEVTYRNSPGGLIGAYLTHDGGLYYHFELIRDFPNYFRGLEGGEDTGTVFGDLMRTDSVGPLSSFGSMGTQFYPYVLLALLAGVPLTLLLAQASGLVSRGRLAAARLRAPSLPWAPMAVAGLALLAFGLSFFLNARFYEFLPHLPDEVSYVFQAHLLADLKITDAMPPVPEAFYFYEPTFLYERNGQWASFYPFGHPALLAVGVLVGAIEVVPSLVGAATVVMTFVVGRRLYDARTGLLAAALLVASPFFLMQSANFMSHSTGALYLLIALHFILRRDRPVLFGALAGLFFGLGVNTRALTMVALVLPFGALMLSYLVTRVEHPMTWLKHSLPFAAAGLLMLAAMLAYNYGITGEPFTSPYTGTQGETSELFGFRSGHTLDIGLRNEAAQLMALLMVFNGWPGFAALALVALPFLLGTTNRWDYFLAACVILMTGIYLGYRYSGIYEGPRYWYEAVPFLMLLSARGAEAAARFFVAAAALIRHRIALSARPPYWAGASIVYVTIAVLVVWGSGAWLFGWNDRENVPLIPRRASAMHGLFDVDDRLHDLAHDLELENALILVEPCGSFNSSNCYGSVFLRNLPNFDGDVVWARYIPGENEAVIAAYPDRDVYVASWDPAASIRPYQDEPGTQGAETNTPLR